MENAERMYVNEASDVTNMAELCSRDLGASGSEFKVMIKSGSESAARVTCPYALLADYTFTYTSSDGSVTCRADDVGTLGMCANTEEVAVTAPSCSRYPLYASSSTSVCVDVLEVSGHTYTSLFNGGSTSTDSALFACVGLSADGLSLSVSPLYCRKNQVPTELPVANTGANIGAVLNLTATSACPFLNDIENGVVTVDEAFLTATYVCDVNYTLTGGVLRTCDKSTYIWSGSEPSCVIEEATGGGAEATSGGTNLLPVVIVFAILTVVFGVGFAVALLYIFKLRKGKHNNKRPENHPPPNFDANHFKSSKTSPRSNGTDDTNSLLAGDGRLHSFQFLSRPPMEHRQHLLTSASSAIPRSSRAPHGHMNLGKEIDIE
ncbi:hypothetical protein MAR_022226 [Mya arenaria]|uniref:Sushi domain-containing protein n=1 Tax=Mya arenaria TaxID=6604 RepID=A0ABY7DLT4_MYAAR|nr:hypothetical protein MAR_022226 [Mya arenaria]